MHQKLFGLTEILLIAGIVILSGGGFAYAYFARLLPFSPAPVIEADTSLSQLATSKEPTKTTAASSAQPTSSSSTQPTASAQPTTSASAVPTESATSAPNNPKAAMQANDQKRKDDLALIQAALEQRYKETKDYPVSANFAEGRTSSRSTPLQVLVGRYMNRNDLPTDPKEPDRWYGYKSDGKTYTLSAQLEDTGDPEGTYADSLYLYTLKNLNQ